ncbi:hypothetical protein GCM10023096_69750 [Nonomuraea ferruginea]
MPRSATTLLAAVLVFSGHLLIGPLAFEDHAARAVGAPADPNRGVHKGFAPQALRAISAQALR